MPEDRVFISAGYGLGCTMLSITKGPDDSFTATESGRDST